MKRRQFLRLLLAILLVTTLLPVFPASAKETEPIVKVKLKNYLGNPNDITVSPAIDYKTNINGLTLFAQHTYHLKVSSNTIHILEGSKQLGAATSFSATPINGNGPISINDRPYLGSFDFTIENGTIIRPINSVSMENYLKGVVPFEMPALWDKEALKAQAVAARTYALGYNGKTIDDTINYQVYGGYEWNPNSTEAVDETSGQVITYNGQSIGTGAVFSASNGGKTETNENAWGSPLSPYFTIKDDPYDPAFPWSVDVHKTQIDLSKLNLAQADSWWSTVKETDQNITSNIKNWLKSKGYINQDVKITAIPSLNLYGKTSGGRVSLGSITIQYLVKNSTGTAVLQSLALKDIPASSIRAMLGGSLMKSYLVDGIQTNNNTITISGKGNGHGVGLSQWGAKIAADQGKSYLDILSFYYDGTQVHKIYSVETEPSTPEKPDSAPVITKPVETPTPSVPSTSADKTAPVIQVIKTAYDLKTGNVQLSYTVNENANTSVSVKDAKGKVISTLLNGTLQQSGSHTVLWNTNKMANGSYTFVITAKDSSNNTSITTVPYKLTKDTIAPVIKNLKALFMDKTNKVNINYFLSENSFVTITVKNSKGSIVATLEKNVSEKSGNKSINWDVSKIGNGQYTIMISAIDPSNNRGTAQYTYTLTKTHTGKVTASTLNIRSQPSISSKIIGALKKNQTVTIIQKTGSWYQIMAGNKKGYVFSKYLLVK
jgi:stage II sporulation protein D